MRIRYSNALLWRGLDDSPAYTEFDVVDNRMAESVGDAEYSVDLKGAFVMPAFRDGHCHPIFAGREHVGPDVTNARTLQEIKVIVADYALRNPNVDWIDGAAYDRSIQANFTRFELDEISADRPIVLHGADHHTLWVNTKALELCGLFENIPRVSTGSIELDSNGVPSGMLREWEAMQLVLNRIPPLTTGQELDCLDWAQEQLLSSGVVEVQDAWIDPGMAEIYLEAAKQNRLIVATNLAFRADPASWEADFEYFDRVRESVNNQKHPLLRANAIKFFVDGVLGSSTASLVEPYVSGPGVHSHGEQVWSTDELTRAAEVASDRGYQLHLHAIGDQAVRTALNVIEAVEPVIAAVIAHTELVSDEDIPRFAQLGVIANFEPLWAREDGQLMSCVPQVGRARIDKMYRMRDLTEAGALLSFGSDWPVSSPDTILGLATAVNRSLPGGRGWALDQALSVREALNAYTAGVALQVSNGVRTGTIFVDEPAEFLVLSRNPLAVSPEQLFDIQILGVNTSRNPLQLI